MSGQILSNISSFYLNPDKQNWWGCGMPIFLIPIKMTWNYMPQKELRNSTVVKLPHKCHWAPAWSINRPICQSLQLCQTQLTDGGFHTHLLLFQIFSTGSLTSLRSDSNSLFEIKLTSNLLWFLWLTKKKQKQKNPHRGIVKISPIWIPGFSHNLQHRLKKICIFNNLIRWFLCTCLKDKGY